MDTAKRLIDLLADEPTPRPFMSVLSMDAVALEWESAGRELTITVLPDGTLDYARATPSGEVTESHGSFAAREVREQLRWLRPPV